MLRDGASKVPPSPRERRYPATRGPCWRSRWALSARAEVPRLGASPASGVGGPLRASGGTPTARSAGKSGPPPSPRERRYPACVSDHISSTWALSARAEVPRSHIGIHRALRCPLRASGGTPPATARETGLAWPSPRERRYPSPRRYRASRTQGPLRASGGTPDRAVGLLLLCGPSPRERRYPGRLGRRHPQGPALSARAEVPRDHEPTACPVVSPLRASGGTP